MLNQCVSRALDRSRPPHLAQASTHERRLARAKIAGQRDYHSRTQFGYESGAGRARPAELVPGTLCVVTARLNYLPPDARASEEVLADPAKAFIARYALGRDYHKVLRAKLERLAGRIRDETGAFGYRVFTD